MNIACTACSARYGVADEKLIGKRVRITCKRCGTVLIVDGNTNPPTVSASTSMAPSPPASTRPAAEARAPAPEPPFMVAFADGRQEQADIAQIVRFHRAGQLGADSLVWREGMGDWSDPWDVAEISAAFRRMGYSRPTPAPAPPPAAPALHDAVDDEATQVVDSSPHHQEPLFDDNEATNVVDSSRLASPEPLRDPRVASRPVTEDDEGPTHVGRERGASTHGTAAAREAQRGRRVSSRPPRETAKNEPQRAARQPEPQRARAERRSRSAHPAEEPGQGDMFARQRMAGSEDEQAEAPQNLGPGYELDIPKLTGARNESSVLFSLDTLLKQEQKSVRPAPRPRRDESLLVDSGGSLPFGGGGIAPALAAPDFTAPVSSPPPQFAPARAAVAEDEKTRSSRAWLYILVLVAFGGAGALGWKTGALRPLLIKALGGSPPPTASADSAPPPSAAPVQERAPATSSAEPEGSAVASAAASAGAAPTASAAEKPAAAAVGTAPRAPATGTAATPRATTGAATSTATGAHETATKEKEAPHEAAAATAAAPAAGGAAFDTGAAKEVLTAAAGNVASCKEMGGPVGSGKVSITFAPSGRPTSVAVSGALVGTTVGSCVARLFRSVKVPPFAGDAVTVAKGFSLE